MLRLLLGKAASTDAIVAFATIRLAPLQRAPNRAGGEVREGLRSQEEVTSEAGGRQGGGSAARAISNSANA